ncbi:nucleotide exchange factor GrpE [Dactylosporangium darangshiense]|uniref:Nucleotide exchange factor GrpE n=1 Tax=Dactylosporangium darangshiense TaxID=579108 RepID=A0ABP8DHH7_9ACTN
MIAKAAAWWRQMRRGRGETPPDPERDLLVAAMIDIGDRLRDRDPALWKRLNRHLGEVGVECVIVDGQPYDERLHDAVGREPTADPDLQKTVASTERAGYVDRGRVLRLPEVMVFRTEGIGDDG